MRTELGINPFIPKFPLLYAVSQNPKWTSLGAEVLQQDTGMGNNVLWKAMDSFSKYGAFSVGFEPPCSSVRSECSVYHYTSFLDRELEVPRDSLHWGSQCWKVVELVSEAQVVALRIPLNIRLWWRNLCIPCTLIGLWLLGRSDQVRQLSGWHVLGWFGFGGGGLPAGVFPLSSPHATHTFWVFEGTLITGGKHDGQGGWFEGGLLEWNGYLGNLGCSVHGEYKRNLWKRNSKTNK